jgi:hypothetical protein
MTKDLDKFDALDRAEILCASVVIDRQPDCTFLRQNLLAETLAHLPAAITEQLARLGMLF